LTAAGGVLGLHDRAEERLGGAGFPGGGADRERARLVDGGGEDDRTDEVADQRAHPDDYEIADPDVAPEQPLEHGHRVAGEELGSGEDHEGQGDAEHGALYELAEG